MRKFPEIPACFSDTTEEENFSDSEYLLWLPQPQNEKMISINSHKDLHGDVNPPCRQVPEG